MCVGRLGYGTLAVTSWAMASKHRCGASFGVVLGPQFARSRLPPRHPLLSSTSPAEWVRSVTCPSSTGAVFAWLASTISARSCATRRAEQASLNRMNRASSCCAYSRANAIRTARSAATDRNASAARIDHDVSRVGQWLALHRLRKVAGRASFPFQELSFGESDAASCGARERQ